MKILVIGNGGREHALAWKISQSPLVKKVFIAPGNAGTMLESKILENIAISSIDIVGLLQFVKYKKIDLTIVGPEEPLILGIVDLFRNANLKIIGPNKAASRLESSKIFSKNFLSRHNIPTPKYQSFIDPQSALTYIRKKGTPIVIKADGLAAGKGVIVAMTLKEAEAAVYNMMIGNRFGKAGHHIVIEEFIEGKEVSFIVIVDKNHILPMATSQDYKKVGEGNSGPNTGGMGAYSPSLLVTDVLHQRIMNQIIWPTINGMKAEGNTYTGFLYAGLILDKGGNPKVLEFNCRLGDPETQTIMLRLQSDLLSLCLAAVNNNLNQENIIWDSRACICIVLASKGYPEIYQTGYRIYGLPCTTGLESKIFHAGTAIKNNLVITNGGRVLCITSLGHDISQAQKNAYELAKNIFWNGCFYRRDIGCPVVLN